MDGRTIINTEKLNERAGLRDGVGCWRGGWGREWGHVNYILFIIYFKRTNNPNGSKNIQYKVFLLFFFRCSVVFQKQITCMSQQS